MSCETFWFHRLLSTCLAVFGFLVQRVLPSSSLAGALPVLSCIVRGGSICKQNSCQLDMIELVVVFLTPFFTMCTAFSAKPLVDEW